MSSQGVPLKPDDGRDDAEGGNIPRNRTLGASRGRATGRPITDNVRGRDASINQNPSTLRPRGIVHPVTIRSDDATINFVLIENFMNAEEFTLNGVDMREYSECDLIPLDNGDVILINENGIRPLNEDDVFSDSDDEDESSEDHNDMDVVPGNDHGTEPCNPCDVQDVVIENDQEDKVSNEHGAEVLVEQNNDLSKTTSNLVVDNDDADFMSEEDINEMLEAGEGNISEDDEEITVCSGSSS